MNRRALLGGFGSLGATGLSGCVCLPAPSWSDDAPPADSISLGARDPVPDRYDLDVEVVRVEFTEERPAAVRIATTNRGEPVALSVVSGCCSIFARREGGSDDPPGLWFRRPGSGGVDREDGRWVANRPPGEPRRFPDVGCRMRTYRTGQSIGSAYQVWDDYRTEGHLVPGTYEWRTSIRVSDASADPDDGRSFSWGFSLALEV